MKLNRMIDHTILKPEATEQDVIDLCEEGKKYDFWSVVVNTHYVSLAASQVKGSEVKVCSIAGFPLGAVRSAVKAFEAERAVADGADEIDMVLNIGAFKSGRKGLARDDIAGVVKAAGPDTLVKVIIEAAVLTDAEKQEACRLAEEAGAGFVKTSTGFGPPGANPRDVRIMKEAIGGRIGVKASAGIRTAAAALELIEAGADRIGTSSGVEIMKGFRAGSS
ncbi:MAG: deoxyribose-phosphate aldolase [Candidatus Latescibacteria bacterium]|nr:deoxyribose-phosphate aldolase [bacterium]MBD3422907.1 deoxyribose-phosphate aldolase [Candidatus Latescibacterota bacterium]